MKWNDFLLLKAIAVMVILNLAVPWLV